MSLVDDSLPAAHEPDGEPAPSFPPGSVGDLSLRIGYDIRDLVMQGYSWDEIQDVVYGRCTLEGLLSRGPRRKRSQEE